MPLHSTLLTQCLAHNGYNPGITHTLRHHLSECVQLSGRIVSDGQLLSVVIAVSDCKSHKLSNGAIIGIAIAGGILVLGVLFATAVLLKRAWARDLLFGRSLQGDRRRSSALKVGRVG